MNVITAATLAREFQARSEGCKSQNGSTNDPIAVSTPGSVLEFICADNNAMQ